MRYGGFVKQTRSKEYICNFVKSYLELRKQHKMILYTGELGRENYATKRYFIIIKYWFKILQVPENKYIKIIYNMMIKDIEELPKKANWASLVRDFVSIIRIPRSWGAFLSVLKQRLSDTFMQNWHDRINNSSRANFYKTVMQFQFQPYLEKMNVCRIYSSTQQIKGVLAQISNRIW